MKTFRVTVLLCTYNPAEVFLRRTLEALRNQDLALDQWELLLVDNASAVPVAPRVDLSWHPHARCLAEPSPGLGRARACGLRAARGALVVYVDDDNVLAPDYLTTTCKVADTKPWVGVWGGQNLPEFERQPERWLRPYWWLLALREVEREVWTNMPGRAGPALPVGAGMVARREVVRAYLAKCAADPDRLEFGRKGAALMGGEDNDLAMTAIDIGLGMGVFPELQLVHLIPAKRLAVDYLERLMAGIELSHHRLERLRKPDHMPVQESVLARWYWRFWQARQCHPCVRRIENAKRAARLMFCAEVKGKTRQ